MDRDSQGQPVAWNIIPDARWEWVRNALLWALLAFLCVIVVGVAIRLTWK